jgi:hypothetical protein
MAATYIEQPSKGQLRAGRPAGASACRVSIALFLQSQLLPEAHLRTCAVRVEVLDNMLCGVQRVGAGEGYEVVEKQAAAAGSLRKKAHALCSAHAALPHPSFRRLI